MLQVEKHIDCLFVVSPGKYVGGAEKYVQCVAAKLHEAHQRDVLVGVSHSRAFYDETKQSTIPAVYLGDSLNDASKSLSRLLNKLKPTVVISNGYHSAYLVTLARLRSLMRKNQTTPLFIDIKHGWININLQERFKTLIDKFLAHSFDKVIVVNPTMKDELVSMQPDKVDFIPSGVDIPRIRTCEIPDSQCKPFRILLVGRLAKEKRFGLVIEALSQVKDRLWNLLVVGDGPEAEYLKNLVFQLKVEEKVLFVGYQSNVCSYYDGADLMIISSVNEGCPLVALEAMARNVIVLSTRVGYMTTLLDDRRGFLVGTGMDSKTLTRKVNEIIDTSAEEIEAIREKAFAYVNSYHNIESAASIYNTMISSR